MNQKFICICVALMVVLAPSGASARSSKAVADASQNVVGQTVSITGVVTDTKGEPLAGASVLVKGTTKGTTADLDGKYTISAGSQQTLVVSFIGFKDQEVEVKGRAQINVALEVDADVLDDVVVVGYGSIKKANLTGSVDQITPASLENRTTANLDQLLTGVATNLDIQVTDGAPYRTAYGYQLRGIQVIGNPSIPTESSTLVLVDGVEYNGLDGDLSLINPNDIESISVLKDAAAASIYGGKAAYGVVLITTKNPQKKDKVTVNYSANFSIMKPTQMPDLVTDGEEYMDFIAQAYYNYNGTYKTVSNLEPAKVSPDVLRDAYRTYNGSTQVAKNGAYTYYGNTDWYDYIYKDNASAQVHNINVSGSSGKVDYTVSGRYYDYSGLYVGDTDRYNTMNLRSKINAEVFKWLKISENIDYTYDDIYMGTATTGDGLSTPEAKLFTYGAPTWKVYNPDGTFTKAGAAILGGLIGDEAGNDVSKLNTKKKISKSFRTTTGATASFFDNTLRLKADYTYRDKGVRVTQAYVSPYYSESQDVVTTLLAAKNLYKQAVKEQERETSYNMLNAYAEYENTFSKHYLKAMAGYNYEKKSYRTWEMRKRGLETANADAGNLWNVALGEPTDDNTAYLGEAGYVGTGLPDTYTNSYTYRRTAGVFGRINYSFADRYLLEVNARYDGSSYFSYGNQWGFFPSASAGWRVSQEPWWNVNPKAVSSLKIRASYGALGDANGAGAYATETIFEKDEITSRVINGSHNTQHLVYPSEIKSQYTWSTVKTTNIGADVAFFNNKLDISGDYYVRRNTNMLAEGMTHSDTYGSDAAIGNYADISTYGWELTMHYNDSWMVAGKPLNFSAHLGISDTWAYVDRYEGNTAKAFGNGCYREGQKIGELWGFKTNGIFQNEDEIATAFNGNPYVNTAIQTNSDKSTKPGDLWILDLNGNGQVDYGSKTVDDPGDMTIIGNAYAKCPYNFGFSADWNNFFASIEFNGVMHQDWTPGKSHMFWSQYTNSNGPLTKWLTQNVWTEDNTDAFLPRIATGNKIFNGHDNPYSKYIAKYPVDRYLFNIGYINIKNVQVGYSLPRNLVRKANLSAVKVFLQGENLWNWSPLYRKIGRDFNVMSIAYGGDDYNDGMSWWNSDGGYQYPKMATFTLGIIINY